MSRETDSSSTGPHGYGGPAYAPGPEPYGAAEPGETTDPGPSGEEPGAPTDASAEEPRTETTLTTRIRINIPGSRPIPPVVMRKPVEEGDGDDESSGDAGSSAASGGSATAATGAGGDGHGPEAAPPPGIRSGASKGAGDGGGFTQETSDWFQPRKPPRPTPEPTPEPAGGPHGRTAPSGAEQGADRTGTPPDGVPVLDPGTDGGMPHSALADLATGPPSGPTSGPRTGDMAVPPPAPGTPPMPSKEQPGLGLGTGPSTFADGGVTDTAASPAPATAEPEAEAAGRGPSGEERISSDTLVSGIPRVPSMDPGPGTTGAGAPPSPDDDVTPDRAEHDPGGGEPDEAPPTSKGRSKLMLVGAGLVGVLAVAYGTGLLLDHADVPNGTTVLGVNIGGKDTEEAVNALESALGDRTTAPMTVVVNGDKKQIKPKVAGLTIDTEETVQQAAGRDYNPISVIGSLLGGTREAEAVLKVDEEKLNLVLSGLSNGGGSDGTGGSARSQDGMVVFKGGEAKTVPGQPHQSVNVDKAAEKLEDAYLRRAATGKNRPVELPVRTQQPEISRKELKAAAEGFGETAMSGWVWLRAGDVTVPFSQETIGTFLTMQPGGGTLQPVIDTKKLAEAYGSAFEGVVIDAGAGTVEMTPRHAAAAMIQALKKPAPPEPEKRVAKVPGARRQ